MSKLKKLFAKVLSIEESKINEKLSKENTSEWDSFNNLLLISEIEKQFNINFTITEAEEIKTFEDISKLLINKGINTNEII